MGRKIRRRSKFRERGGGEIKISRTEEENLGGEIKVSRSEEEKGVQKMG